MPATEPWKPRDLQILRLLGEGMSDREIATRLGLKSDTVRWYNKRIYERLGVSSRIQAVRRAIALGLLATQVAPLAPPPVARSEVRYVQRDGVSVAYVVIGSGPIDLVFLPSFTSNIEEMLALDEWRGFLERLGRFARLFVFDQRGTGLSDRTAAPAALHETAEDLRAMLGAEGSTSTYLLGCSAGGPAAIVLATTHPDIVDGLILFGAMAVTVPRGETLPWARTPEQFAERRDALVAGWGGPVAVEAYAPSRAREPAFREWWGRFLRTSSSPGDARRLLDAIGEIDVRPLLPLVGVRTLVLHRVDDAVVPVGAGRYLAERIPGATFLELPGADHVVFLDQEPVLEAVRGFLEGPGRQESPDAWVAILLHVSGPHSRLEGEVRQLADASSPRRLHELPDGWIAVFDSPTRALRLAERLRSRGRGRMGALALHVGACDRRTNLPLPDALAGLLAIARRAPALELRLSATLRDIIPDPDGRFERVEASDGEPGHWRLRR